MLAQNVLEVISGENQPTPGVPRKRQSLIYVPRNLPLSTRLLDLEIDMRKSHLASYPFSHLTSGGARIDVNQKFYFTVHFTLVKVIFIDQEPRQEGEKEKKGEGSREEGRGGTVDQDRGTDSSFKRTYSGLAAQLNTVVLPYG